MELKEEWILADEVFENPLLRSNLLGLKYYGLLLHDTQCFKKLHCFRGAVFTLSMVLFNLTQYIDLGQVWGSVSDMTANAATTLLFTTTIFRIIFFYAHRARFNNIIRVANEGIKRIVKDAWMDEQNILISNVRYLKRLSVLFWSCALITANTMCVFSLVQYFIYERPPSGSSEGEKGGRVGASMNSSTTQLYPAKILRSWYPTSPGNDHFVEIYLIQLYIMYVGQLIVPSWHMFMVTLMIYGRIECNVLNHRVRSLARYHKVHAAERIQIKSNSFDPVDNPERRTLIIDCVKRQSNLVAFTRELEQLTRAAVFLDFVVFSVLLCALLLEASITTSVVQIFIDICYITTMTTILFLYYWHANEINVCVGTKWGKKYEKMDNRDVHFQANQLSMSAYNSDWYRYDRTTNQMLQLFIMYSNRPLKMHAYFITMSLDTFLAILRASYSYFTILKQLTD
ncbi:AGAP011631-PA-like protein [Anopheles sinensis]|uniref:AGAP011631-PA-like protein n=1 Tax=Anopheles sinensis TaxID=74873 RepID=A0A084WQ18_ANOSI|nr:AGAP011631-PA-like protein [Anopheles sinensis]